MCNNWRYCCNLLCLRKSKNTEPTYKALWTYNAREEEELSFKKADRFKVVKDSGEWWVVKKVDCDGKTLETGIVPNLYLAREDTIDAHPWYFGRMSRLESERLLRAMDNGEGAFLVRVSEKDKVGSVLSVKTDDKVKHYRIFEDGEKKYYVYQNHSFTKLWELVNFYKEHSLTGEKTTTLGASCIRPSPKPKDLSHSTVDEWELPKEHFTLMEELGSGYFSKVYQGRWKDSVNVAIKVLNKEESLTLINLNKETQVLKKLQHRHLIALFGICSASTPYYIVTELMEKGSLLQFLRGEEGMTLDVHSLLDMAVQVADGMAYLELNNSIHRDLAARNVLLGEDYICKVADFGLARITKEPYYLDNATKKLPYKWTAPEAISHHRFSIKSDVWSYGVLLYEILTYGGIPYPGTENQEVYEKIMKGYRMPPPPGCPDNIYEIMLSCWSTDPHKRPSFSFLKSRISTINLPEEWF